MAEEKKKVGGDLAANGARGEVPLSVGGLELVVAAEMGRLAAVSTSLGCKSMADLFARLTEVEPAAVLAGLRFLTVRGDVDKAIEKLRLSDFKSCAEAFAQALAHHWQDDEAGNAGAADKAA